MIYLILFSAFILSSCTVRHAPNRNSTGPTIVKDSAPQALPPKRPVNPTTLQETVQTPAPVVTPGPDWTGQTPDQLRLALQDPKNAASRSELLFRLGEQEMVRRNVDLATNYFNQVLATDVTSVWSVEAKNNLELLRSLSKVSPTTIGVLLPLSGRGGAVGQRALKAIQMGLGLHYGSSNFQLAIVDTQGNLDKARRGVERLVREDNVVAIIGALSSREAESAAAKADELGTPLITLSQRSGITDLSPYIYRNALTPEMQIHHLVRTAMGQYGMKKFAIMYPNDAYGVESANQFWDEVLVRGGEITAAQSYDPSTTDFKHTAQRLVGSFYIEARLDEYRAKQREFALKNKKRSSRENLSPDDILPPIINFDAIFIPDSAKNMGQISAFLSYVGVKDVHLLGTNLWNTPGLARRAGQFQNALLFVDGFVQNSSSSKNSRFVTEFQSLFKDFPSMMEIQAFESALILRGLVLSGASARQEVRDELLKLQNFPGAVSPLTMSPDREVLRPLFSLTLRKGEVIPLDISE
jgi:branched-chain amino acid transport system substrate-binding protein